jgi:hypothetical protein
VLKTRSKSNYLDQWRGGYIQRDSNGDKVYVIRKARGAKRYHRSTGAHTEEGAVAHLARFKADPAGYETWGALVISPTGARGSVAGAGSGRVAAITSSNLLGAYPVDPVSHGANFFALRHRHRP